MPVTVTREDRWTSDWWCPQDQRFVDCPGPCNDGRTHVKRSRWIRAIIMRADTREEAMEFWESNRTIEQSMEYFRKNYEKT